MSRAKPVSRSSFLDPREVPRSLLVTSAVMLVLRVVWIFRFREIDADAYGHYFIAVATRRDPGNIHVHWVWLPLFHFVVGAFTKIGLTFRGVRLAGALLATLPPLLVWDALRPRNGEVARYAALAFAVSPLLTILGQSAQPEMLFLVFVTASLHAAAKERPLRAGVWLALACLVRYEAWGAALAASVWWLGKDRTRAWLAFAAVPCGAVALYILLRWWTDGALLLFFRGTREAQVAREAWTFDDVIDFPLVLPRRVFGVALLAAPFGWKILTGREKALAAGFTAFLLFSYYAGGSHAAERYFASLSPFAWMMVGAGWPRRREIMVALVALTMIWHLHRAARMAIDWDEGLREREQKLEEERVRP